MAESSPLPAPLSVTGFHGTTVRNAVAILNSGFHLSKNPYDWLGDGVYFFQDAPERAWEWAFEHHGTEAAVLGARIRLVDCMDLLDITWARVISEVYDRFLDHYKRADLNLPVQTGGSHRLDREVFNYTVGVLAEEGSIIRCVRASFDEGRPVYPNSAIFERSHVQIAVRDVEACIVQLWLER